MNRNNNDDGPVNNAWSFEKWLTNEEQTTMDDHHSQKKTDEWAMNHNGNNDQPAKQWVSVNAKMIN